MRSAPTPPAELAPPDELAYGIDSTPSSATVQLAAFLAKAFGPATLGILHYGSQAQRSDARAESAHDFFVIVDDYRAAYTHLTEHVGTRFSPNTATALAHWLPPNVVALTGWVGHTQRPAKCAVYSAAHFREATSAQAKDHFAQGRLFQHVQLVWARDAEARTVVRDGLLRIRERTFAWGRPSLPAGFDVERYCRTLLETSFAAEIRPEAAERVNVLLAAQRDTLDHAYGALLEWLAERELVVREGAGAAGAYRLAAPVTAAERRRVRAYFARSKRRATLRWVKYVVLYDDWLGYIVRKIERRSGITIALTARERRWPLIFLWPRAIRFVLHRPQRTTVERE